jgi:DNA-directed RNA polymerase subunit RPC12/RpoP
MPYLEETLKLKRCPHCSVDNPNLVTVFNEFKTTNDNNDYTRVWRIYKCVRCGGIITANCLTNSRYVQEIFPKSFTVNDILPIKVKAFLQQAIDSVYAPAGSVMLCASAVDEMLKEKGYKDGKLYSRINKASQDGLLTSDMAIWAHQVRLDANDQRHADEVAELPTIEDAEKSIEFTKVLAEFLFVLPSKVKTGIDTSTPKVQQQ